MFILLSFLLSQKYENSYNKKFKTFWTKCTNKKRHIQKTLQEIYRVSVIKYTGKILCCLDNNSKNKHKLKTNENKQKMHP